MLRREWVCCFSDAGAPKRALFCSSAAYLQQCTCRVHIICMICSEYMYVHRYRRSVFNQRANNLNSGEVLPDIPT